MQSYVLSGSQEKTKNFVPRSDRDCDRSEQLAFYDDETIGPMLHDDESLARPVLHTIAAAAEAYS